MNNLQLTYLLKKLANLAGFLQNYDTYLPKVASYSVFKLNNSVSKQQQQSDDGLKKIVNF